MMMVAAIAAGMNAGATTLTLGVPGTGDGGRGFGVLAEYGEGGPRKVVVTRRSAYDNPAEMPPSYFRKWGTLCSLRVYGPDGFLAAYLEMGDQRVKEQTYEVEIPEGAAGIWRFSVSGGFTPCGALKGDEFDFTIPETPAWGVRGEKRLMVIGGWPEDSSQKEHKENSVPSVPLCEKNHGYLVFSPASDLFYLTGRGVEWSIDGKQIEGETGKSEYGPAILAHRPQGAQIVELAFDSAKPWSLFVDGLPGLVSPTPEMARRLGGGLVQAKNGEWLEGPLQAKAMDLAMELPEEARTGFRFDNIPVHDVFHYTNCRYDPRRLAEEATNDLARARAVACGLLSIAHMDAAGILRQTEKSDSHQLTGGRIDCATMFEPMSGIGRGYPLAKAFLTPEQDRIYREGVLQITDKEIGFMCYQCNQFSHIIEGEFGIFLATGEKRLERAVAMQLRALLRNDFMGKHGQTDSGFFSEEYGPDGNYDQMSLAPLSRIYRDWRNRPDADKELLAMLKAGIEKNLRFRSMFAIPDPATTNGAPYQLAYAMNHRTDGPTHFDSHHGLKILSETGEFPLAEAMLNFGKRGFKEEEPLIFGRKERIDRKENVAEMGGFAAVRRGPWYGVQFWRVYENGADGFLGPLFLWHEKAGLGFCGIKHSYGPGNFPHWFGNAMTTNDITFATVYGELDGSLYIPSRKMRKTLSWDEKGKRYTVTGVQYAPKKANGDSLVRGKIAWMTDYTDDGAVEMEVAVDFPDLKNPIVNLPFLDMNGRTVWTRAGRRPWRLEAGRYEQQSPSGTFVLTFPEEVKAEVAENLTGNRGWTMALRLAVPESGRVKFRLEAKGGQ